MRRIALPLILASLALLVAGCEQHRDDPTAPVQVRFKKEKFPKLKVDQSNDASDQLGVGNGLWGQTFTPQTENLAQVDLLLMINNLGEAVPTWVGLYVDITQEPLGTTVAIVEPPQPGQLNRTVSFVFDPPLPLEKKTMYTIGLYAPYTVVAWEFAFGDPYPDGQVVLYDGSPLNPIADFVFTTYTRKK